MAMELPRTIRSRLASSTMGRLSPSMISPPTANSFMHVAHVEPKKEANAVDADDGEPSWTMVLAELPDGGVSPATVLEQHDNAEEYMKRSPPAEVKDNKLNRELRSAPSVRVVP